MDDEYKIILIGMFTFLFMDNNYLLLLGIACLFIAGTDLIHNRAYPVGQSKMGSN